MTFHLSDRIRELKLVKAKQYDAVRIEYHLSSTIHNDDDGHSQLKLFNRLPFQSRAKQSKVVATIPVDKI